MQKTKIVCTIGPASCNEDIIKEMIKSGMNVARLNFSHGTHEQHLETFEKLRNISSELNVPLAILQDLQGPKIRTGKMAGGSLLLEKGHKIIITTEEIEGHDNIIPTTYMNLPEDVIQGNTILLDDGLMELHVEKIAENMVYCDVITGGLIKNNKGINLPGVNVSAPSLTEKDLKDLKWGIEHKVDFIALSFVRNAKAIIEVKDIIEKHGSSIQVIAKLEKPEALEHLEEILDASDGVMIARGDLGVEMKAEKVPTLQKHIIKKANIKDKFIITATQMLSSMENNPRPTRAEVNDVANAIYDGTDAVMLSGETSTGTYPLESVKMMSLICEEAESNEGNFSGELTKPHLNKNYRVVDSICHAASVLCETLKAKAVIVFTCTGFTAQLISKYRLKKDIFAITPDVITVRRTCLYRGITPILISGITGIDEFIEKVDEILIEKNILKKGDFVVIAGSSQPGVKGTTNFIKIHNIGEKADIK